MFELDLAHSALLVICLIAACSFEFVNGFHDTANAVATVIYTNSLRPWIAVIWSGIWNFLGVFAGGIAVAVGIINLLPVETLVDQNIAHSLSMVIALLADRYFLESPNMVSGYSLQQLSYADRINTGSWSSLFVAAGSRW